MRTFRLLLPALLILPAAAFAQIGVSVTIAPPLLPVYSQPMAPADGYLWTPGYWAYGNEGYFWVPGAWVMAPEVGLLWTPGYWGWGSSAYAWNAGYWGPHVGFYGGINYGFGYGGFGYQGGYWNNGFFNYNRAVNNVNITNVHSVYNKTVINNGRMNRVSYNGGRGGINARPNGVEETAGREQHTPPTAIQAEHLRSARTDHAPLASVNHGRPALAAGAKPAKLNRRAREAANTKAGSPRESAKRGVASATTKSAPRTVNTAINRVPGRETARGTPTKRLSAPRPSNEFDKPNAGRVATAGHARPAPRPTPRVAGVRPAPRPTAAVADARPAPRPAAPVARAQPASRPTVQAEKPGSEQRPRQ